MIRGFIIALLFTFSFSSNAQVTGQVEDEDGLALAFVNVILLNANDSSFVKGLNTSLDGDFEIGEIMAGRYLINLQMLGYHTWHSAPIEITSVQQEYELGTIVLKPEGIDLEGVEVTAKRMVFEQSIEGTTVNVQNSLMTKGSSALQVLERSPGVIIDQRNGDFSLNGQQGVLVLINGKRIRMSSVEIVNFLQSMSADNIKKIELLTNPSAKYDAEGNAGIINIVLEKGSSEGTHGSLSVSAGYGWSDKETVSLNLNHHVNAVNIYGTYSFSRDDSFFDFGGEGKSNLDAIGNVQRSNFYNQRFLKRNGHNINLGLDFGLSDQLTYGVNLNANIAKTDTENINNSSYAFNLDSLLRTAVEVLGYNKWNNIATSFYFEKAIGTQRKFNFNLDHLYFGTKQPTRAYSTFFDIEDNAISPSNADLFADEHRGLSNTTVNVGVAKLDYRMNLASDLKLEMGLKAVYSNSNNLGKIERKDGEDWITDDRNHSELEIKESIGAIYSSATYDLDSTAQLVGGLRYEYWDRRFSASNPTTSFGRFFPSVFFSKKLSTYTSLSFAYNKRITQPDYNDLASTLIYNNEISVFAGNPLLQPSISNSFKLTYAYKGKSFSVSYTKEDNPIARYQLVENDQSNLITVAPQNVRYQKSWTLQTNIPWELKKWWTMNIGGSLAYRSFQLAHTKEALRHNYFFYNIYGSQQIKLPADLTAELSGWLLSNHYNGSIKVDGFGMLNFGLKKQFKNSSSLQFTITDLFKSMRVQSFYGKLTREAFDIESKVNYKSESANNRIFKLTYFWSFGNTEKKFRQKNTSGADAEKSRIRTD